MHRRVRKRRVKRQSANLIPIFSAPLLVENRTILPCSHVAVCCCCSWNVALLAPHRDGPSTFMCRMLAPSNIIEVCALLDCFMDAERPTHGCDTAHSTTKPHCENRVCCSCGDGHHAGHLGCWFDTVKGDAWAVGRG